MDWFRWHHGTVTDRKWPRIASRAGTTVANVIAVWAALLEAASQAEDRGSVHLSDDDCEDLDAALGMPADTTGAVIAELSARDLIGDDNRLTAWDRRQPKREREDNSAERVRKYRERLRSSGEASEQQETPSGTDETGVTPCNAAVTTETPRGEERRGEETDQEQESSVDDSRAPAAPEAPTRSDPVPYQAIVDAYNATMTGLAKVRDITGKRRTRMRNAWTGRRKSVAFWEAYFAECQRDDFLSGKGPYGRGHENWRPDFDYLTREEVIVKTYERAIDRMERGHE
jgi:hypothetical protein